MQITSTSLTLDGARVRTLTDIDPYPLKIAMVFPTAAPELVEQHRPTFEPEHMRGDDILLAIQSYVLEIDGRVILIDTCAGEHKPRPTRPLFNQRSSSGFLGRLAALGLEPGQVDIVFCTHLHVDHVGWNTQLVDGRWVPTFPNARYIMGRRELAHWQAVQAREEANHGSFRDSVLPVVEAGQVDLVDDGYQMGAGLTLQPLPGHSPGQMGLWLDKGNARALFAGDAIHHPLQLIQPELSTGFCTDPGEARISRQTMLASLADSGGLLLPAHFRHCCGWRIERHGAGYRKAG